MDRVSFAGASLAGALFTNVRFDGVDFSHASRVGETVADRDALDYRKGGQGTSDPILGARWDNVTYDCATKWPAGFHPARYGFLPSSSRCVDRAAVSFDRIVADDLRVEGVDLSGASFTDAKLSALAHIGFWGDGFPTLAGATRGLSGSGGLPVAMGGVG